MVFAVIIVAQVFCFSFSLYVIIISVFVVFLGESSPFGDPKKRDCKGPERIFLEIFDQSCHILR
jgi:hypothetical protein